MVNVTFSEAPEEEGEPDFPSYRDPGRVFFEIQHVYRCNSKPFSWRRYEIEVIDHDGDSSVYWLNEGMGVEYWLQGLIDLDEPGFYVVEGVTGEYIRGDGWTTDDDEEWYFEFIRRADPEEIKEGGLRCRS